MDKTTLEGNRLISEFIGHDVILKETKYHTSWDEIMKVISVIEKDRAFSFTINNWHYNGEYQCYIHYCFDLEINSTRKLLVQNVGKNKLECVFNSVVEYIKRMKFINFEYIIIETTDKTNIVLSEGKLNTIENSDNLKKGDTYVDIFCIGDKIDLYGLNLNTNEYYIEETGIGVFEVFRNSFDQETFENCFKINSSTDKSVSCNSIDINSLKKIFEAHNSKKTKY